MQFVVFEALIAEVDWSDRQNTMISV